MENNFYQQFFDAQKKMFETWSEQMKKMFPGFEAPKMPEVFEMPKLEMPEAFQKAQETAQEIWKKLGESMKSYQSIFELWKTLSEKQGGLTGEDLLKINDAWAARNFTTYRELVLPQLPEQMKDFATKCADTMEANSQTASDYMREMVETGSFLGKALKDAQGKGTKGVVDYLAAWEKAYDDTMGKMMAAPTFGKDMAMWSQQKASFDRYVKYCLAYARFALAMLDVIADATKKVAADYQQMAAEGTQPKTFDEFYRYWQKVVNKAYSQAQFTDEMSALAGKMVDAMSNFKIENDKLIEMYLADFPVVRKSDLDSLYKSVHDLKQEVRGLKAELAAMKAPAGK